MLVVAVRYVPFGLADWWLLAPALAARCVVDAARARLGDAACGRMQRAEDSAWCRTQALRYLPGGIWAPVSRGAIMHGSSRRPARHRGRGERRLARAPRWRSAASRSPRRQARVVAARYRAAVPPVGRRASPRRAPRRPSGRAARRSTTSSRSPATWSPPCSSRGDLRLARPGHVAGAACLVLGGRARRRHRAERRRRARVGLRRAAQGPDRPRRPRRRRARAARGDDRGRADVLSCAAARADSPEATLRRR